MNSKRAKVPDGYRCPFCPDHADDTFFESKVFGRPICEGCQIEIDVFVQESERREDAVVVAVERFTGHPWAEVRLSLLQEKLDDWLALDRDRPASFVDSFPPELEWTADKAWDYVKRQIHSTRNLLQDADGTR